LFAAATRRGEQHDDAELSRTVCATYRRVVARNRGFKEQALRTCEALLRIHRATEGRSRTDAEEPVPVAQADR
jgi:hypothetical protein